ncbi:MAG: hypothetical protein KKD28_14280 [Chloroflexi bacterium]|nr:hypothetical protein [Chloroflexota bacterium]MBU1662628.1 hypothetical protein [Chloroflexota bacterium]
MKHLKRLRPAEEERILEAIFDGLSILRSKQGLVWIDEEIKKRDKRRSIEDRVSRALYRCLKQAQNNLKKMGQDLMGILYWQMPIQPNHNVSSEEHEDKIPDFSWQIFENAITLEEQERPGLPLSVYFHIECKRLGSPTSSSWKLNPNYVHDGVVRFVSDGHRYGQHTQSGAMIGYLEDMTCEEILRAVNAAIEQVQQTLPSPIKISPLSLSQDGWQTKSTSRLNHRLERSFLKSPFTLWHFWLDLRECYPRR